MIFLFLEKGLCMDTQKETRSERERALEGERGREIGLVNV